MTAQMKQLVQKWRYSARTECQYGDSFRSAETQCADELESALSAGGPMGNGGASDGLPRVRDPGVDAFDIDAIVACLGDDAAAMLDENPEDERALNMQDAAYLIEALATLSRVRPQPATPPSPQREEWRNFATAVHSAIINCNIENTTDEDTIGVLHDTALDLLAPGRGATDAETPNAESCSTQSLLHPKHNDGQEDAALDLLEAAKNTLYGIFKGDPHATHNAANMRNRIDVFLQGRQIDRLAARQQPLAATDWRVCRTCNGTGHQLHTSDAQCETCKGRGI